MTWGQPLRAVQVPQTRGTKRTQPLQRKPPGCSPGEGGPGPPPAATPTSFLLSAEELSSLDTNSLLLKLSLMPLAGDLEDEDLEVAPFLSPFPFTCFSCFFFFFFDLSLRGVGWERGERWRYLAGSALAPGTARFWGARPCQPLASTLTPCGCQPCCTPSWPSRSPAWRLPPSDPTPAAGARGQRGPPSSSSTHLHPTLLPLLITQLTSQPEDVPSPSQLPICAAPRSQEQGRVSHIQPPLPYQARPWASHPSPPSSPWT